MKLIRINTETGIFIEDVIVSTFPQITVQQEVTDEEGNTSTVDVQVNDPQYISVPCEGGFYHPRWDNTQWVEGLTPEQIQAILDGVIVEPTLEDRVYVTETKVVTIEETIDVLFGGAV